MTRALVLLFTLSWAASNDSAVELGVRLVALEGREPALKTLIEDAVAQSGLPTLTEFLKRVGVCDSATGEYAAVKQSSEDSVVYLGRVLEEPTADPDGLKRFYAERFKESLVQADGARWSVEPDLVVVTRASKQRLICLRPGERLEASVDAIVHELVHYARISRETETDILGYKGLDDYAVRTILLPGEEVDAYLFQYGVALRAEGRVVLGASPTLARLFSATGDFVGRREELVPYVLDELGYRQKRFRPEYKAQLAQALQRAESRRKIMGELLDARKKQRLEFEQALVSRNRLLSHVWPSYGDETRRLARLADSARESIKRLEAGLEAGDDRGKQLRAALERAT